MARSYPVSTGTAPTLLVTAPPGNSAGPTGWFLAQNSTAASCYVGAGTAVSSANGVLVGTSATTNTLSGYLFAGDVLYFAASSGTATTTVLVTGA